MANINELIPIEERNGKQAVNARHLYAWLGSKRQFSDWIKEQIDYCDLVQGADYQSLTQICEKPQGGRPSIEYALSISAAKEISMVSRSKKGKEARRYFIECEKIAKNMSMTELPSYQIQDPIERAQRWIEEQKLLQLTAKRADEAEQQVVTLTNEVQERDEVIIRQQPKVEHFDMFMDGFGDNQDVSVRCFVNQARINGEEQFWKWLYEKRIVYRNAIGKPMPYAEYADIFVLKDVVCNSNGWSGQQMKVSGDKKVKLAKMYYKEHPERFFEPIIRQDKQLAIWQ